MGGTSGADRPCPVHYCALPQRRTIREWAATILLPNSVARARTKWDGMLGFMAYPIENSESTGIGRYLMGLP
jgi:hypothetical protein